MSSASSPQPERSVVQPEDRQSSVADRKTWFARYAKDQIMPLLGRAAKTANARGRKATFRLGQTNGHLSAELVIVPRGLPAGAPPPRLSFYATEGERPLMVEYTGTFPGIGATGGFGAEVEYDPIYTDLVEEKIRDFIVLAVGV